MNETCHRILPYRDVRVDELSGLEMRALSLDAGARIRHGDAEDIEEHRTHWYDALAHLGNAVNHERSLRARKLLRSRPRPRPYQRRDTE